MLHKGKSHLVEPLPPAVARLNRLKRQGEAEGWSNLFLRRMIRYESMLVYKCLEPKERLESFKEPIELTEFEIEGFGWVTKTFKRKNNNVGPIARSDVTPVRIPVANKYAYLVGREENFGNPGFEETLTPLTNSKKRNAASPETPRPKRRRKQKSSKRSDIVSQSTKNIAEKRNANFSPEFTNPNQIKITSPLNKKQRRATFKKNDTFTKFALMPILWS